MTALAKERGALGLDDAENGRLAYRAREPSPVVHLVRVLVAAILVERVAIGSVAERAAFVLDRELKDYESEYHYLFRRLKEMQAEQDGTIVRAYPVPNIARKVWDTFLMYRVPSGDTPYMKMEKLKEAGFDAQKLDAIYKFTNSQSHITGGGFDPALVPETQKVLAELFEMMQKIAPDHYAVLDGATAP